MSCVAIIPARGGSKGVPMKNIRPINGLPLIAYTIKAALDSELFEDVIVSTDSEEIANVAREYGADVPFVRPADISGDMATSDAVVTHAIDFMKKQGKEYDEVFKLQPTSPLRTATHIKEAYSLFKEKNADFVVSFCECEHTPLWSGELGEDGSIDGFMSNLDKSACRQSYPTFYRLNGAIYIAKVDKFIENGSFIGKNGFAYVMEQIDSIDIDSQLDFNFAEFLIGAKK